MSSYLSFYLVPKLTKKKYTYEDYTSKEEEIKISEGIPLFLTCYSRNSDVYQAYNETLNPAYGGMEDKYTEVSYEDAKRVATEFEEDLQKSIDRLAINYKILKEGGYNEDIWSEIQSSEEYIKEQKETLQQLNFIAGLIHDITKHTSDFEKVLINID